MKPVRIAPPASDKFTEAVRWYERRRIGLGAEFYDAICARRRPRARAPEIGMTIASSPTHREFLIDRFPYKVIYRERTDDLYIVAIAHTSRRPGYWKNRP